MRLRARDVKAAARGRWLGILENLAPALDPALGRIGRHVACPVHRGNNGDGFRLFRDVAESGGGICNTCGAKPNGLDLLQWVNGWTFRETVEAVAGYLGLSARTPSLAPRASYVPARPKFKRSDGQLRETLRRIWRECISVTHPAAETARRYLHRRGLSAKQLSEVSAVRFHPELIYRDEEGRQTGVFPALVCLITDAAGRPATLHRIYLSPSGEKAPVDAPKKMMPVLEGRSVTGGCVQLGRIRPVLGIAEGVETALAVNRATGMTVWAAVNATLLERWEPPTEAEAVYIWADLDRPDRKTGVRRGEEAAERLRRRLSEMGIEASILIPASPIPEGSTGLDWNDVLLEQGSYGFPCPTAFRQAA